MRKILTVLAIGAVACLLTSTAQAAHSDHGCHNCHVPHHSGDEADPTVYGVPLWSTAQSSDGLPVFVLYSTPKFDSLVDDITQPDGPSKLCLGCHDGSYAYFAYIPDSEAIFEAGDLARSHPISFTYDSALATASNGGLKDPGDDSGIGGSIALDLLDDQGKVQCTSCHDVHTSGKSEYLLKYDYDLDLGNDQDICRACHNK